jgi:DNA helicase II / ATP-dependent DNA helicase PcrA
MKFIADFHIHSHYSMATSKNLIPEHLDYWARLKGITVVGTGDFTHPGWCAELEEKLEPAEEGLFRLKPGLSRCKELETPFLPSRDVRFLLTCEISSIYKKNGKVRKVHNVIFAPDFETVEKIRGKLTVIGANITSDGRPILGLDSRDLLEMALESNENILFVPAHIWTPWFSALGSKSGFDTIAECYDDLADHISTVETGLSTDPPMNWMCSFLDRYTLISNSDAHSPEKLGRNANRFDTELSYNAIVQALRTGDPQHFKGSIDLFPQEGKYHYDGHRKCNIRWNPVETLRNKGICSKCGKPVTVGVMNRAVHLSDREDLDLRPNRHPFASIITLKDMLAELEKVGPGSKKVSQRYMTILKKGVTELELLLETPLEEIRKLDGPELTEAVSRMRNREIYIQEGYDGEYGVIKVFAPNESPVPLQNSALFKDLPQIDRPTPQRRKMINFDLEEYRRLIDTATDQLQVEPQKNDIINGSPTLNPQQQAAVEHYQGPALVIAGPGTGKTKVLTQRIQHLIENRHIEPEHILAVTFTNKAAAEIGERVRQALPNLDASNSPKICTFHGLGYSILKENGRTAPEGFSILDPEDKHIIFQRVCGLEKTKAAEFSTAVETAKQRLLEPTDFDNESPELANAFSIYNNYLREHNTYDLDDLIAEPIRLFDRDEQILAAYRDKFQWILIDEYQDINYAQYRLIRTLMPNPDSNLCAIGDPDQAIYGFRGADVAYIRRYLEDYPGAVEYRLKRSYRCTDSILKASSNIMKRGNSRVHALDGVDEGIKIKIVKSSTHKSEAEFVARTIEQMMGGLRFFSMDSSITQGNKETDIESLSDFAVLCRVKNQIEAIEKAFQDHSIPYQSIGEEPFFKQEPVASIIDLIKMARNPQNKILEARLAQKRVLGPDGIGAIDTHIGSGIRVKETIIHLVESYFSHLKEAEPLPIRRLVEWSEDFGFDLDRFLQSVSLGIPADTYRPELENVALMTIHAAKGLEFKAVFIVGCEDGLLPYSLFKNLTTDREEERRLLYVGMTRAKRFLFLSHAEKRFLRGIEYQLNRSPFLDGIERKLIELSQQDRKKEKSAPIQRTLFNLD